MWLTANVSQCILTRLGTAWNLQSPSHPRRVSNWCTPNPTLYSFEIICEAIPSSCTGTMQFSNIALRSSVCQRSQSSTGYVKYRTSASLFRPRVVTGCVGVTVAPNLPNRRHRVTWVRPGGVLIWALRSKCHDATGTTGPATVAVAAPLRPSRARCSWRAGPESAECP